MSLYTDLRKAAQADPVLKAHLAPLLRKHAAKEASKDPSVEARSMIDRTDFLFTRMNEHQKNIRSEFEDAKRQAEGLDRFGSGTISAPGLLKKPFDSIVGARDFLNKIIKHMEPIVAIGKR